MRHEQETQTGWNDCTELPLQQKNVNMYRVHGKNLFCIIGMFIFNFSQQQKLLLAQTFLGSLVNFFFRGGRDKSPILTVFVVILKFVTVLFEWVPGGIFVAKYHQI